MINVSELLQIMTSIFTIILIIVVTILGIRLIQIVNKAEQLLDDVEEKVNSLNGVFGVIEKASQGLDLIGSKFIDSITNLIYKFFKKKKEEDDYE